MNPKRQIKTTKLNIIDNNKGKIFHALKATDQDFQTFGEAYFTEIIKNETKGWKKHSHMTMNLIVPVGRVIFHIWDDEKNQGYNVDLSSDNYRRLCVPKNYWVSFTGYQDFNLILNIASIEHDPEEALNAPINSYPIDTENFKYL